MLKFSFKSLLFTVFIGFTLSCNKTTSIDPLPEPVMEISVKKSEAQKEIELKRSFCFRNETVHKENPENIDILELKLDIIGSSVTGIYNWLPKFKDKREGFITGIIAENIIQGKYQFTQEGKEETIPIEIQLNQDSVIISEDDKGVGIGAVIDRTNCSL